MQTVYVSPSELYLFFLDKSLTEPFKSFGKFLPMFQYDNPVKINFSVIPGFKIDVLKVEIHKNVSWP